MKPPRAMKERRPHSPPASTSDSIDLGKVAKSARANESDDRLVEF